MGRSQRRRKTKREKSRAAWYRPRVHGVPLHTSLKRPEESRSERARRTLRTARASRCAHRSTSRGRTRARRSARRSVYFATRARSGSGRSRPDPARIAETQDLARSRASEGVEEESARETGFVISRTVDSGRIREGTLARPLDGVSKPVVARARASGLSVLVRSFCTPRKPRPSCA